ncbi:MAG: hypothetical protein R6X25_01765 [Candidatus Krumholzibacteriia bacterium]
MRRSNLILATLLAGLFTMAAVTTPVWASGALTRSERGSGLERGALESALRSGGPLSQTEIGGDRYEPESRRVGRGGGSTVLPIVMSAVLPGAGEVYLGHKRGWLMMAADLAAWYGVHHYNQEGEDTRDEYYAFADAHWSEDKFKAAYNVLADDEYIAGYGLEYYAVDNQTGLPPLFIAKEDDRREYYENLGKWDQFVFGWDDFRRPDDPPSGIVYDPTGGVIDLQQPWVSRNRETYRALRKESNDAFGNRDTLVYVNIGLRVFSVLQVAYLQGLLGGDDEGSALKVAGHRVEIIAEPRGFTSSRVGAAVSF